MVRSGAQLRRVVADNPFTKKKVGPKELHATFLSTEASSGQARGGRPRRHAFPTSSRSATVSSTRVSATEWRDRRLPNWERVLGVSATTRNWNTTTRLLALLDD